MQEKIITLGEIMLRLTPPEYNTIAQTNTFIATYGGGEANVAVALSHFGHRTAFVTKLPQNQLGDSAIAHLLSHGVDTTHIVRGSSTMGIYFLETGFGGRPSKVIYNRKHSAATKITVEELNFDEIFRDASWFHVSGISLALGPSVREVIFACLKACRNHHVTVSFDFNYRSRLWSIEEARPHYQRVLPYADILFASAFDAATILQYTGDPALSEEENRIGNFKKMIEDYQLRYIFGTDRTVFSATENALSAFCVGSSTVLRTEPIKFNIYDRIGGGDAFASGVIHGLIRNGEDPQYALQFGLAASVLKHTLYGDMCTLSVEDIEAFMKTNGHGRVER